MLSLQSSRTGRGHEPSRLKHKRCRIPQEDPSFPSGSDIPVHPSEWCQSARLCPHPWFGCLHWTFLPRHWAVSDSDRSLSLVVWGGAELMTWHISIFCLVVILWIWELWGIPFSKNCFMWRKRNVFMCHRCNFWGKYINLLITLQYRKCESHLMASTAVSYLSWVNQRSVSWGRKAMSLNLAGNSFPGINPEIICLKRLFFSNLKSRWWIFQHSNCLCQSSYSPGLLALCIHCPSSLGCVCLALLLLFHFSWITKPQE